MCAPRTLATGSVTDDLLSEFGNASFGHVGLRRRLLRIVELMAQSPDTSLPNMMGSESELEAAYYFFNSEKVTPLRILWPHFEATAARISAAQEVLIVHDTSDMDYGGKRKGLGDLGGKKRGYLAHVSLAVSVASGLPLGVLNLELLTRPDLPRSVRRQRRKTMQKRSVMGDSENVRWSAGVENSEKWIPKKVHGIHVMDSEGGSFPLLARLTEAELPFLVRLNQHPRNLVPTGERPAAELHAALESQDAQVKRTITISKRTPKITARDSLKKHPPREERTAHVEFTATQVNLKRPKGYPATLLHSLPMNIVHVREPQPPDDAEPVEWILATTEPVDTPEAIARVVDLYRLRWIIEEFFQALKSGCAVLEREFENASALQNVLAVSLPIAWQMLALRTQARIEPDAPATQVFTHTQLDLLRLATEDQPPRKQLPPKPSVKQALVALAALGGHKTSNGDPGWKIIARALHKLIQIERYGRLYERRLHSG